MAAEASLDHYYSADLRDWYRGKLTARWLWSRLYSLPLDSPLALSVNEDEGETPPDPSVAQPWPPKELWRIPVAPSMAAVGKVLSGADLN